MSATTQEAQPGTPSDIVEQKVRTPRLPTLTGMRWAAALVVFLFHIKSFQYFGGEDQKLVAWAFGPGSVGVTFFFVLSGFVMAWSSRPGDKAVSFWRRRLARIFPMHVVTLLAAMAIGYTVLPLLKPDGKSEIVANFFLVNVWHYEWWTGINPVAWSLACEAFFYACFPFLYAVLRRLGPKALATLVAACILTEMVLPAVSRALDTGVVLYCFPPTRLLEFVLGIAAARLVQLGRWRGPGLEGATALTVVGFFMAPQFTGAYACTTVLGFTLLIAAGAVADINGLPSMWRSRPMVKLGEWSFAFYMVHVLVLEVLRRVVGNHPQLETLPAVGSTALAFILSLALAAALYRFVELPGQRLVLGRRKGSNRPA